jgi:two-component system CheB/CheR fusion protein
LKPGAFLFLGTSETLSEFDRFFTAIDRKAKLFQRRPGEAVPQESLDFTGPRVIDDNLYPIFAKPGKELNVREFTEKVLLQDYSPACVLVNEQGEIVYFHGKTGRYLEPASGEASLNLLRMAREDLRPALTTSLRKAIGQKQEILHENVHLRTAQGDHTIDLVVSPVTEPISMQGLFLVVFEDRVVPQRAEAVETVDTVADERDQHLIEMERELQATREYLRTAIEELETTNEELKSTNEELQSSNEELQSTNEELETSKEELQSVNEELVTVNAELQHKIDEMTWANNDLHNLLANVEVGFIFVDQELHVKRFNPAATRLTNLIETDIGRPIGHIASNLIHEDMIRDAREVLDTLNPREMEVQTKDGRWYWMRIRPYRTVENAIEGLVITFSDMTEQKHKKEQIQIAREYAEAIVNTVREPLIVLDSDLRIVSANASFYASFLVESGEVEGRRIYELGNQQWDIPALRELLERILPEDSVFNDYRMEHDFENIGRRVMLLNGRRTVSSHEAGQHILLAIEDITGRK